MLFQVLCSLDASMKTILILSANPKSTSALRLDLEVRHIREALKLSRSRDNFKLESREAVRWKDIRRAIEDLQPVIVQFSGHGNGENGLAVEDEDGTVRLVTSDALMRMFKLFPCVQCVVLNACHSETQARAIHKHVPCVVGMSLSIGDRAAREFSEAFYDGLGSGRNYKDAYELGLSGIANDVEVWTPILLWREVKLKDTKLFQKNTENLQLPQINIKDHRISYTVVSIIILISTTFILRSRFLNSTPTTNISPSQLKAIQVGANGNNIQNSYVKSFEKNGDLEILGTPTTLIKAWSAYGASGTIQEFTGGKEDEGALILSTTRDEIYWVGGSFWRTFKDTQGTQGLLVYPVSNRYASGQGFRQDFKGGAILKSSNGIFAVWGGIGGYYLNSEKGELGRLGFPIEVELGVGAGIHIQRFEKGCIRYDAKGSPTETIILPKSC